MKKFTLLFSLIIFLLLLGSVKSASAAGCFIENDPVPAGSGAIIVANGLNDIDYLVRINHSSDSNIYTHACGAAQNGKLRISSNPLSVDGFYTAYIAPKKAGPCFIMTATVPTNTVASCNFYVSILSPVTPSGTPSGTYDQCEKITDPGEKKECTKCDQSGGSWTALRCIPNDPRDFVVWLLGRAIGIGGGIAFLLMLFGGFQVITSAGDPERLNSGKEIIGSAITGLLLIIFSLFILKLIGVDILGLPEEIDFKFKGP